MNKYPGTQVIILSKFRDYLVNFKILIIETAIKSNKSLLRLKINN